MTYTIEDIYNDIKKSQETFKKLSLVYPQADSPAKNLQETELLLSCKNKNDFLILKQKSKPYSYLYNVSNEYYKKLNGTWKHKKEA